MLGKALHPLLPCLGVITALLLLLALLHPSWTSDMASYLMTRNWVLGQDYTGRMPFHYRPPLVGVLLVPLTAVFGDLWGSKILAAFGVLGFACSIYYLARLWHTPGRAAIVALIGVVNPLTFELVTGGYVSFLSMSFGVILLRQAFERGPRSLWIAALCGFLMTGLNQTVPFVLAIVVACLPVLWRTKSVKVLIAGALGSAVWLPWLLINSALPGLYYGERMDWLLFWWPRNYATYWPPLFAAGAFFIGAAVAFLKGWNKWLAPLFVLCAIVALGYGHIGINNIFGRAQIILPTVFALATVGRLAIPKVWPAAAAVLAVTSFLAADTLADKLRIYSDDNAAALAWIAENTAPTDVIGTHPHGIGWWVGGVTGRYWIPTWQPNPPAYYKEEYAELACALGWTPCPAETPILVDYVVVDNERVEAWTEKTGMGYPAVSAPWLAPVWTQGGVVIYRVTRPTYDEPGSGRSWPWERTKEIDR